MIWFRRFFAFLLMWYGLKFAGVAFDASLANMAEFRLAGAGVAGLAGLVAWMIARSPE